MGIDCTGSRRVPVIRVALPATDLIVDVLSSSNAGKLKNDLSHSHATRMIAPMQYRSFRVTNPDECNRVSTLSMNCHSRLPMEWMIRSLCKSLLPGGGRRRLRRTRRRRRRTRRRRRAPSRADPNEQGSHRARQVGVDDQKLPIRRTRSRGCEGSMSSSRCQFPDVVDRTTANPTRARSPHSLSYPSYGQPRTPAICHPSKPSTAAFDTHARWKGAELKKG